MRTAVWDDYEVIDTTNGEKLERFKNVILIRPDPQIIWKNPKQSPLWKKADARYIRSNTGGGHWQNFKNTPDSWVINYKDMAFNLKLMGFKHTGIFPEQAVNWDFIRQKIKNSKKQMNVLNLFAYTGAATVAALKAGAKVCHVDSSKGMVAWAKENIKLNNLEAAPVRFIVDDCVKFVKREIRRNNKYDAIIMDPPSYGRGPKGETWRLEDDIYEFLSLISELLSDDAGFVILNSYTSGLSCAVMDYMLSMIIKNKFGGSVCSDEIGLKVTSTGLTLPCGSSAIWSKNQSI
ncbi:MAG: class I SAM-dependent methyltransferase [Clostridia bacterium]|nr:class I SAM-dependent methyltransferase [Clostridia bacterium]